MQSTSSIRKTWLDAFVKKDGNGYSRCRYARFVRFIVLLCIFFLISGCTSSSVQIGEFCIPKSNQYKIDDVSSLHEIRTREGKMIPTYDTTIKMTGSQYGIGAAWFDGVTLEEAKRYFDEHAFSEDSSLDDHFNVQIQEPGSIDACDSVSQSGVSGYLVKVESIADLGEPYSYYLETFIFPTSDDSIGALISVAHSDEQKETQERLLDEVMSGLMVDQ